MKASDMIDISLARNNHIKISDLITEIANQYSDITADYGLETGMSMKKQIVLESLIECSKKLTTVEEW